MTVSTITVLAMARNSRHRYDERGYRFVTKGTPKDPVPDVEGDTGQFYLDAVADDAGASWLMELLRRQNPDEYEHYRKMAAEDFIDLDESQDVFMRANRRKLDELVRLKAEKEKR